MEIKNVYFDENNMRDTRRSLRCLRDVLARGLEHKLWVVRIPTKDMLCGFAIFDQDEGSVTFTGDGFRDSVYSSDEVSIGHRSALVLLDLFGIGWSCWGFSIDFSQILEALNCWSDLTNPLQANRPPTLEDVFQVMADLIPDSEFQIPIEETPRYYVHRG